jgi:hypothetical protein
MIVLQLQLKGSANFWTNATGMTFALIIGGAALSLLLSEKFEELIQLKRIKGAAIGCFRNASKHA